MSNPNSARQIFRRGSTTYFTSSLFFPANVKQPITDLYAFVRVADDLVDSIPSQTEAFQEFCQDFTQARKGIQVSNPVITNFVHLEQIYAFPKHWAEAFLRSMSQDLHQKTYQTMPELEEYIYGSANVIGLFLAKIMDLPKESYPYAEQLGKAMQYINFIRDIDQDIRLGRIYFPQNQLQKYGLEEFTPDYLQNRNPQGFQDFIRAQIDTYRQWQALAEPGLRKLPRRYQIPIRTASDMYQWTASVIQARPSIVFDQKVKPSKLRILATACKLSLTPSPLPVNPGRLTT